MTTPQTGWTISVDTAPMMVLALYIRDAADLGPCGHPQLAPLLPGVRYADPHQLTAHAGGVEALREEWELWWHGLCLGGEHAVEQLTPPSFGEFAGSPALRRYLQAHFGSGLLWSRERVAEYRQVTDTRDALHQHSILRRLVEERELDVDRSARPFRLQIIELPLAEKRAWFVEPDRLLIGHTLLTDEAATREFLEPVLELLV
ncbi:hypothetical protein V6N00_00290 [Tersicoccus sp. MR15.9]|uniref:hypothetical protein n=1 Tax=Tersicoccus mangrovi TaxID=3121635 RepID=UPI002FE5C8EA